MNRQIQSALRATDAELLELHNNLELRDKYMEAMGGDKVRIYDVHGKNNLYIEDILAQLGDKVGMIIFDMLDNLKFPTTKEVREDQRLEQMYQWSRELGVKYDCHVFPTSQVSNEGAGLQFPTEAMLKDSKTGKQGACDNILMIGASDDPLLEHNRYISLPKQKSKRAGKENLRAELILNGERGIYV